MNNYNLCSNSRKLIEKVLFNYYSPTEEPLPEHLDGRIIIHLYPTEDTEKESGELNGFHDSLFFNMHVYHIISKKRYIVIIS